MGEVEKEKKTNNSGGGQQSPPQRSQYRRDPCNYTAHRRNSVLQSTKSIHSPTTDTCSSTSGQNTSSGGVQVYWSAITSQYIGGSSDYHIDTQFMKTVPMEQKVPWLTDTRH